MAQDKIVIVGARQHNLKNINLEIPRDKLVVITGISGSGKSSLAFDTLYAEGQRRYVESLSAYARQFLGQMDKPDVDYIEGLSPAVSIDQKSTTRNPRSTVGTVTEIYDYLRLLYARIGIPHCPQCGKVISQQTVEQMVDTVMAFPEGTRVMILAPLVRGRKGEYRQLFEEIQKEGFLRVRVDGQIYEVSDDIELDRYKQHTIEAVVDRLVVREEARSRLAESIETALEFGKGLVAVHLPEGLSSNGREPQDFLFSEQFACPDCGVSIGEIAPRNFSFNSPYGACPECHGLGLLTEFDPDLILDRNLSIENGAILPFADTGSDYFLSLFRSVARACGFDEYTPLNQVPEEKLRPLLYGFGQRVPVAYHDHHGRYHSFMARWEGLIPLLRRRYEETSSQALKEELEQYMSSHPCPACKGQRLRPESLAVTVGGLNIAELTRFSVLQALDFFRNLRLTEREQIIAHQIIKEITARLGFLINVGLDYLTLDRPASTLAGGEAQRIRLATQIGSGLMGVLYILDEPSIGLHQRDNHKLIETLLKLRDLGNTIIVVEHDEDTIRTADWVIDIGPGAGAKGGYVVATGTPEEIARNPHSITGQYLSGQRSIPVPKRRRRPEKGWIELLGASQHNLKNIDLRIPLGCFVCITGVSGSGKSTLIQETLFPLLKSKLYGGRGAIGKYREIRGWEQIDKVIDIDQSPIGRTPRSNPATYTGTFDLIRDLFSQTTEAKIRGYKPGRFSFNVKGGRCEACKGDGIVKIEMHFLPDVYVPCEVCKGKRFNRETLEVKFKGKNIADVLDMTVEEALEFFSSIPPIARKLQTIHDVGLDYIKLGQPATTLSGGEAQRVKLSTELSKRGTGRTLYILDEPTTGLHFEDIKKLLEVLNRLVDAGNTVIVIEHNMDVIKTADWIVDLGPEGGDKGGWIIAEGPPEKVAQVEKSYTGQFLRRVLTK